MKEIKIIVNNEVLEALQFIKERWEIKNHNTDYGYSFDEIIRNLILEEELYLKNID